MRVRLDTLAVDFADGTLTDSQLRAATTRLKGKLADVEARLAASGRVHAAGPLVAARDKQAAWAAMSMSQRRAVVDSLAKVTVYPPGRGRRVFDPATVKIDWR